MKPNTIIESDPYNRPLPHTFCAPKHNSVVIWLCKKTAFLNIRKKLKVSEIEISDADLLKLRSLRGKRCLLMPSHSGGFEPYLIVYLSKLLKDSFFYLAAIEAFQRNPIIGWIMQRMGAYSIIRGTADRKSFQMTKKILAEGKRWLVIFPEGQTVWQNDTVIPFQEGVTQMAFKSIENLDENATDKSLICIPMAIKYVYLKNMDSEIEESLKRLESQFFSEAPPLLDSSYERLLRIGSEMLAANEKTHKIKPDDDKSFNERIQNMKEAVVGNIEQKLDICPRSDQDLLDRIRSCFNTLDCIITADETGSSYQQKLDHEYIQSLQPLYYDLWRVLQLVAIYDGYVAESTTTERLLDVLCLLEMETFNERRIWGPRKAVIKLCNPIDLKDLISDYKIDKRAVIHRTSMILESSVRNTLKKLAEEYGTHFR